MVYRRNRVLQSLGAIGRITTAGVITEFPIAAGEAPSGITSGPDGALWFALAGSSGNMIQG